MHTNEVRKACPIWNEWILIALIPQSSLNCIKSEKGNKDFYQIHLEIKKLWQSNKLAQSEMHWFLLSCLNFSTKKERYAKKIYEFQMTNLGYIAQSEMH